MTPPAADVLVVGGGPAGAATAWALASRGMRVVVADRAHFPRPKPCAEYISPEASRYLDTMGLLAAARAAGAETLSGMRVRSPRGDVLTGEWGAASGFRGAHTHGLALRRDTLDALVLDAARRGGAHVIEGARVVDIRRDGTGRVTGALLGDGSELRCRILVGADGLRSVVARRLALGVASRWPRRIAFVAHYAGVAGQRTHGEMHVEVDGYVGLAPVDAGLTNVAVVVPERHVRAAAGNAALFMEEWLARRAHLAERLAAAARVGPVRPIGPFGWRTTRAWAPGAALVGDAAEFLDPFTGEGIYAALSGANLLAGYVVDAFNASSVSSSDDALRAYDRARRATYRGKRLVERVVATVVGSPFLMNRVARGLSRRRDLADTLVGVTGDVVPAGAVLRPGYVAALAHAAFLPQR